MTLSLPRSRSPEPVPAEFSVPLPEGTAEPDTAVLAAAIALVLDRYGVSWPVLGPDGAARRADLSGTLADLTSSPEPLAHNDLAVAVLDADATESSAVWSLGVHRGALRGRYDRSTMDEFTAVRMAEHVAAVLTAPGDTPVASFDLLLAGERANLRSWNPAAPVTYPATTLHRLFREQAARTPERPALRLAGRELTYGELDAASDRLARRLQPFVEAAGDPVVLSGDRSLELFTAILAIFKAGGCFVHLDPSLPQRRAEAILRQTSAVAVLRTASAHPATDLPGALAVERLLDESADGLVPDIAHDESTAYLFFTSGSTGEPKGVLRPHRMHTARIFLEQGMYSLGPDDRVLLKSAISFRESWWPLSTGATAVVAEPGRDRDDRYLAELIDTEGVTTVSFVPSMLRLLLRQKAFREASALRHVFVGGEALQADLEAELRACGFEVHNTYTLTEADYVCHRQGPATSATEAGTNVGRALDMHVYLADGAGRLVPPGAVGEIHTGGPGLSDGYLGRPDLTAERFAANTFDPAGPSRLFRTGDLARHRADGTLEYLGRGDAQVKVRGQRVEPTEVELVLREHPAVASAAVVGIADPDQGAVLAAYVVAEGAEPPVRELREFVGERLPDFMVPSYFALVPALPLLDSGKVDRKQLEVRPRTQPDGSGTAPENEDQERVARVVARVLGLDSVGVDDHFFALGGDSLRLMLLRGALEALGGQEIDLAAVLEAGTVRGLTGLLAGDRRSDRPAPRDGSRAGLRRTVLRSRRQPSKEAR
ncbi:non-ribosomal peptide synthetase [Lentzea sp. CA-135723]|uniref:non-ribosomal peptide synthetase n=1 Tax=Lentzea sp. CA-135723 TaxID=3239950 RepID=UPI003D8F2D46